MHEAGLFRERISAPFGDAPLNVGVAGDAWHEERSFSASAKRERPRFPVCLSAKL